MIIDPITEELTIRQGATFEHYFIFEFRDHPQAPFKPFDLTGYGVEMQIRLKKGTEEVICDLTLEGFISIPYGNDGAIHIKIPPEVTLEFNFPSAVYDIILTHPNGVDVIRFAEGNVALSRRVTRR